MRRSVYLTWHRQLALLFAPLLLLQALTGTVLLLRESLARATDPRAATGPALPVSAMAAAASQQGTRVTRLYPSSYPGAQALAYLATQEAETRYAVIEPTSGMILLICEALVIAALSITGPLM